MLTQANARLEDLRSAVRYWWDPEGIPVISMLSAGTILVVYIAAKATGWNENLIKILGLHPENIYSFLSYAVIHEDTIHVIENFLIMILLGPSVERALGQKPYVLMIMSLLLIASIAVAVFADDHWTKYENPVGFSTVTFALITAFAYTASLNKIGNPEKTIRSQIAAMAISTFFCGILIGGTFATNGSASLVGHVTAFICGTIVAGSMALVGHRSRRFKKQNEQDKKSQGTE